MLAQVWAALGMALMGVATSAWGVVLAAADGGSDVAPLLSGGGSLTAVGALVFFARKVFNGELVPRDVAEQGRVTAEAVALMREVRDALYRPASLRTRRGDG